MKKYKVLLVDGEDEIKEAIGIYLEYDIEDSICKINYKYYP